jgi:hypothetical protein
MRDRLFNSICEKAGDKCLETQGRSALDLFAPKLIHKHWKCSIVYSL